MPKYNMLKEIEDGGTFMTHKAINGKNGKYVAIKILKKKFYSIEECRNNKEVQILQKLNHRNVLKMLEVMNDCNELLMVFEYMPDNLKRVMKKRDCPFTETQTKVIMHQVFKGLMHIHKMGYIHRNLRPEVLLCNEEADVVKISDFAMAKSFLDPLGEYSVTPVWYLAPEVLLGANNYSTAVDTWAAGCIMAEFLTGKPLLPGSEVREQMRKICTLIGTFTPREWPDGAMLRRSIDYSLPKDTNGKGLEHSGVTASPEAKGLISDLLTWAPVKRTAAEQALRSEFFKSDGEFENKGESQEILHSAEEKLKCWREKWEADLTRGSLKEFENILAEFTNRPDKDRQMRSRHTFQGFETNNPLLGDMTPRGKYGDKQQQQNTSNVIDDPFRPHKPKRLGGDQKGYPIDNRNDDREADPHPFENDLASREERRMSRQMSHGSQQPRPSDMSPIRVEQQSPRRSNESPRKKDSDLFGTGPDTGEGESEMRNQKTKAKAERLYKKNIIQYKTIYGNPDMNCIMGGSTDADNMGSRSPIKDNGQNKEHVRSSHKSPRRRDTDLFADDGDTQEQCMKDQENKTMKAKKMKADSYLKYRAKFGDDSMRAMVGGKQTGRDELDQENDNYSPERRNRNRVNRPRDTDLFPGDPDERECEEIKNAQNAKAAKMKNENYLQFRTKHGDSFMRSMLGGKDREPSVEETEREDLNLHWDATPRRRRESPRRKDADLFNCDVETSRSIGNEELKIKQLQAENMKAKNELRYRDKFGYNFMKQTLGGADEQDENEQPSNRNNRRNGRAGSRRGRNRNRRSSTLGHMSRKNSSDKFANIDQKARQEKMKALKPLQHKHYYGDDFMRSMVGGNPREQEAEQPLEQEIRYFDQDNGGNRSVDEIMENMAPYSPSWNDNEQRAQ